MKNYQTPEVEIKPFQVEDILTSSAIGSGDGAIDTLDDDEPIIEG